MIGAVGCLEDLFWDAKQKEYLPGLKFDRLERDPTPIRLASKRTADEVREMLWRLDIFSTQPYTPGADTGRPVAIAAVPTGLG